MARIFVDRVVGVTRTSSPRAPRRSAAPKSAVAALAVPSPIESPTQCGWNPTRWCSATALAGRSGSRRCSGTFFDRQLSRQGRQGDVALSISTTLGIDTHAVDASHRAAVSAVEERLFGVMLRNAPKSATSLDGATHASDRVNEIWDWRRRPDLNRGWRFCRPLPYHLATAPVGTRVEKRKVRPRLKVETTARVTAGLVHHEAFHCRSRAGRRAGTDSSAITPVTAATFAWIMSSACQP